MAVISAIAQRWTGEMKRDLPSHYLGLRRDRDRLSDLESGTLSELAFEDELPAADGTLLTVSVVRESLSSPMGLELDVWAREPTAAAEVIVGAVVQGSPLDGLIHEGDAIRKVNGEPCCTIEDVRRLLGTWMQIGFEICRPSQAEIYASGAKVRTTTGDWANVWLCLRSSRVLEIHEDNLEVGKIQIRRAKSVSIHPSRELRLTTADGLNMIFRTSSEADLERWHTLLSQMTLFHPGMRCDLSGWLQRTTGEVGQSRRYFELYSNSIVLIYASPHRNKLGQAHLAVNLSQCSVHMDPEQLGAWQIRDEGRGGTVWQCSSLQPTSPRATVKNVLAAHGQAP